MIVRRAHLIAIAIVVALPVGAAAQSANAPPNALQGFSQNREKPVKIDAASLEVRDKNKIATFSGNVQVVQGDTTLRCKTLAVFYDQETSGNAMPAAQPGPGGQQRIRRLEAKGDVIVTQKDQTATGDRGIFEMAANTVTLDGNVVVRQGQSVLRGKRLTVNLTTGVSNFDGGRVEGLFFPSSAPDKKQEPAQKQDNGSAAAPRNAPAVREGRDNGAPQTRGAPRPSGLY